MGIVGVIPAAGYATRLQPIPGSKEVLPVRGKPVMDYLVERMRVGGCTRLLVVTRPEKADVIAHAEELGAEVVRAYPQSVSESLLAGMKGLDGKDIVLIGFPDTIWAPETGYVPLTRAVQSGCDVALGLFRIQPSELSRSDAVVLRDDGRIERVEVKRANPSSEWIWGCAAARVDTLAGLGRSEWPGGYFDLLCGEGYDVCGSRLSDVWIDIGTKAALRRAESYIIATKPR
jgi:glucose-1-phosphate thymidylyltransferase